MLNVLKAGLGVCALLVLCQAATGGVVNVTIDTSALVGHPAGPFYFVLALTDGGGTGDGNNTVTVSNVSFGGGGSLGSPISFGGVAGSLNAGVTVTDSSFLNVFFQQFAPGSQLIFTISLTSNDDAGTPDGLVFFIFDNSGVPLPTKAPFGDYFLGIDLGSSVPLIDVFASDPSRAPTTGNPVSIPVPAIPVEPIAIDIKPGEDPPGVNPKSNGTIPVAILSSAAFDAPNTVDRASLRFGQTGNEQSLAFCNPGGEDVNGDGRLDLVCHFTNRLTGFSGGDSAATLRGMTMGGLLFQGKDSIRMVGQ